MISPVSATDALVGAFVHLTREAPAPSGFGALCGGSSMQEELPDVESGWHALKQCELRLKSVFALDSLGDNQYPHSTGAVCAFLFTEDNSRNRESLWNLRI